MLAKQGNRGNKVNTKRLALYALFVSICLVVGYLESFLSLTLIAAIPGIRLGLSNAVALVLVCRGDIKGAWAVNIARICLSALLFGSPISLMFSLSGGIASLAVVSVISRLKSVSEIGMSIASGAIHNVFQCVAAMVFVGAGVVYYLPVLLFFGALCGAFCGILAQVTIKKLKTKSNF